MFSYIFTFLLLTMFVCNQECAIIRRVDLDHHKRNLKGNGLEYILHKYLSPLRKLTADLPNHAIEMQIEILDHVSSSTFGTPPTFSAPMPQRRVIRVLNRHPKKIVKSPNGSMWHAGELPFTISNQPIEMQIEFVDQAPMATPPVPVPQRRVIRVLNRHPRKIARSNNDVTSPSEALKQGPEVPEETTTPATTLPPETPPSTTTDAPTTGPTVPEDPMNKPVYMDDLKKALTDLEKKMELKQGPGPAPIITPCTGSSDQIPTSLDHTQSVKVEKIEDILQILKKAVHIEKHVPQPNDDNLNWVQIKIPKN